MNELKKFMEHNSEVGSLWYVASPYTHDDPEVVKHRVEECEKCVKAIIENYSNVVPFSPILYSQPLLQMGVESPGEGWYMFDLPFLRKADRLIVLKLDGWKSSIGVALEIAFARARHIPVLYYSLNELLSDEILF